MPRYDGSYVISKVHSTVVYELETETGQQAGKIYVNDLKPNPPERQHVYTDFFVPDEPETEPEPEPALESLQVPATRPLQADEDDVRSSGDARPVALPAPRRRGRPRRERPNPYLRSPSPRRLRNPSGGASCVGSCRYR